MGNAVPLKTMIPGFFLQEIMRDPTNMSEKDVDRIIRHHLSPINISFQTTNPELRCRMLHNRFAGESLKKVDRFYEAGNTDERPDSALQGF